MMGAIRIKRVFVILSALYSALGFSSARADWAYQRYGDEAASGTLTVSSRFGAPTVSIKQFCYAFKCRVFYQWANHRAIIQNNDQHLGAIVSSITHIAIVDGSVIDFSGSVISDLREGYVLPVDLATKLAIGLKLGKIYEKTEEKKIQLISHMRGTLKTIVIDPGHGGNDLGTGFGGIHEKDVAVLYSLKLRDELKKALPELEIFLTREDDRYVSLPDRAKFANSKSANLFLSLHVNHAPNAKVEGLETYILSPDATDDDAKKTALLENDSWLKNSKIKDTGDAVKKILVDMEQTKYIQESALAASKIQSELKDLEKTHGLKNRGVKQAMFYVLSQVAMPSTLVEMGFLSNTGDRSRMMDVVFRDEFIKKLVSAIKHYRDTIDPVPVKAIDSTATGS